MPAKAPRPGIGRRIAFSEDLKAAEKDWIRVACERDSKDVTLLHSSIGPEDERLCQTQAGVNLWEAISNPVTITHLAVVYWIARRKNGEKGLQYREVVKALPDLAAVIDAGIELYVPDPDGEPDDDEGGADPTQSAEPSGMDGQPSRSTSVSSPGTSAATST